MAKTRKLSSVIRSIKKKNRFSDVVAYIYPEARKVEVIEKVKVKGVSEKVDRYYVGDIPESVRLVRSIYEDPTGRFGNPDDRIWRIVLHEVDVLGVGEIEIIEFIGNNLNLKQKENGTRQHTVRFVYRNGLDLHLDAVKESDDYGFNGPVYFQGDATWGRDDHTARRNPNEPYIAPKDAIEIVWG